MKLNSITIKSPHNFSVTDSKLERTNILASGKTVKEVIAIKKKFSFGYNYILGADLKVIIDLLLQNDFVTLQYDAEEGTEEKIVYVSEINRTLMSIKNDRKYINISFELTEQ